MYATEENANSAPGSNGTSHTHTLFGQTFYMPNGLELGVSYFHGDYDGSLTASYNEGATVSSATSVDGYYYYKLDKSSSPEYHTSWRMIAEESNQRIITTYNITQVDVDSQRTNFFIGCLPKQDVTLNSGYDILIKINAVPVSAFTYAPTPDLAGFISLDSSVILSPGDFVEISANSDSGLISKTGVSKYETPLSWGRNNLNRDINNTSIPEYLAHFKQHIESQKGFAGQALGSNNYDSTAKTVGLENQIVQTNQDIILGAFLLDDHPGNLVDAIRFNANEYEKYKNRLRHEIEKFYDSRPTDNLTKDYILEQVLRNVTTFKIGADVFNSTYILPFGDNYIEQTFLIAVDQVAFNLNYYLDLDKIENSLLVYLDNQLLTVDKDYVISSYAPIQITLNSVTEASSTLVTRLYDANRDSAQCPPTPSTMGLLPLAEPRIEVDSSFSEPVTVLIGHDGSQTQAYGDFRDDILLEFEKRIYNSAKAEFRQANSLPEYNAANIRCGAFRNTGYTHSEFHDLLRHYFSSWAIRNKVDPVTNEFFDANNQWTWNYGNESTPGYWKGWYEFYYDTVRPHTHPWEMFGFTEQPTWWDEEYYLYAEDDLDRLIPFVDYGSNNKKMWSDLEQGIIRQGPRENVTNNRYLNNNLFRRVGLLKLLPVDEQGNLRAPAQITNTGTTEISVSWDNTVNDNSQGFVTNSFVELDGVNVSYDSSNVYVATNNLPRADVTTAVEQQLSYAIPRVADLSSLGSVLPSNMGKRAVGVTVNGDAIMNITDGTSWHDNDEWHYAIPASVDFENVQVNNDGVIVRHVITPDVVGLEDWDTETASPVVGWAFDGLPIYGPYGYSVYNDNTSDVVRIGTGWEVRSSLRSANGAGISAGPGGKHTGQFVEDYALSANSGDISNNFANTNEYNLRYAVTADSPDQPIWHYVVTVDENHDPVFPYHIGGGVASGSDYWLNQYRSQAASVGRVTSISIVDAGGLYTLDPVITIDGDGTGATAQATISNGKLASVTVTNAGSGYSYATATVTPAVGDTSGVRAKVDVEINEFDNTTHKGYVNTSATLAFSSTKSVQYLQTGDISKAWKFNDGAPVEHAWKYTSMYRFAIAEALLLAKPGRFATVFSDPIKLLRPAVNKSQLLSTVTKKRWQFIDSNDFAVHGDVDPNTGDMITNIGYTQFIHSWLNFQGLSTVDDFVTPMRTLNMKLAHRMSGFVDKDTLVARTDQYSNDGNASSLIIPKDNISITLHSSNYKTRNCYTGVIVEKTATGYRVRGFDKNRGYFEIIPSKKASKTQKIEVGGESVDHTLWEPNKTYVRGSIIEHNGAYYEAPARITSGASFDKNVWDRLPKLPQTNSATAVYYTQGTNSVVRIPYETEYTEVQDLFDFLIGLGRKQQIDGFDFGDFDSTINDVKNWLYSAKQFLFWTTGSWEVGNTLELSPLASTVSFVAPRGFIAKINRSDREQFSILDQNGEAVDPESCEIYREDNRIQVTPQAGTQIYSLLLFTKEIEHAMVLDNKTDFNDVIYDDVLFQRHKRIKLKATRTANWDGRFITQGFIIDGDELLPNLDNMAESIGRYHEFGYIPVQRQLYEASRALFGYTEKQYLSELDVNDDEQFDFYKGILQSKGTTTSLSQIGRSRTVVQGSVNVYDEWALRVGDFGDVEKEQALELKLLKSEIANDPQLITLAIPENVTNIIERIDVLDARYAYSKVPTIEISSPKLGGVQATATATLDAATNKISKITVTNPGSNYPESPVARVVASDVVISNSNNKFNSVVATGTNFVNFGSASTFKLNDKLSGNGNVSITVSGTADAANLLTAVNQNADINANISVQIVESHTPGVEYSAVFTGSDFEIWDSSWLGVTAGRYQPTQRYAVDNAIIGSDSVATTESDITIKVDDVEVPYTANSVAQWVYDAGSRQTVSTDETYPKLDTDATRPEGNVLYPVVDNSVTFTLDTPVATANLEKNSDSTYKFLELYINGVRIKNAVDSTAFGDHDFADNSDNDTPPYESEKTPPEVFVTSYNTLYTVTENSIVIPDVSRLPDSVKTTLVNPPTSEVVGSAQRDVLRVLPVGTTVKLVEYPTVQFTEDYQGDIPGKSISIKVTAEEGIAARIGTRRNYEITPDDVNDDVILIDIDDAERFIKKPTGVKQNNLWPTTSEVDHSGILDEKYPRISNAGYVNSANVNFQAFDIASLPDLHSSEILIKPSHRDTIHIANSEDGDWNVYKMQRIDSRRNFIEREADGKVYLYTDYSLFNYLDTNEIGQPDTGKYLDYYLTVKNSNISDNVVVWTNESVVNRAQSLITDIEAPRMIQARIKSIGPANTKAITAVEPYNGRIISGCTLTPTAGSNIVTVTGDVGSISSLDAVRLVDAGTIYEYSASVSQNSSASTFTFDPIGVESITVSNSGAGYQSAPDVVITGSPSGDTAFALATIRGGVGSIAIDQAGTGYANPTVTISPPDLVNGVQAVASATIDANGNITAINVTTAGDGYSQAPTVFIDGAATEVASASATLDGSIDEIFIQRKGSGYSGTSVSVSFVGANTTPATATVTKTAVADTPVHRAYTNAGNSFSGINIQFEASIAQELEFKIDPQRTQDEEAQYQSLKTIINRKYGLTDYDPVTGEFTISHPEMASAGLLTYDSNPSISEIVITSTVRETYVPDSGDYFLVAETGTGTFQIERSNTAYTQNIDVFHMNKSKLTIPGHGKRAGDIVRVESNSFRGEYRIERVIDNNNIVIDTPWTDNFVSGTMYGEGIEIKTVGPHHISPVYAKSGKRVAIHFADPKYYNKVYPISKVKPESIIVDEHWAPTSGTALYYENKTEFVTGEVPYDGTNIDTATNVIRVTDDTRLTENLVTYSSNARIVGANFVTTERDTMYIHPAAIPAQSLDGTYPTIEVNVTRQRRRPSFRYPLLTTLDHDKVTINGNDLRVDNYNNPSALTSSINRSIALRKQHMRKDAPVGTTKLGFLMLQNPDTPLLNNLPARAISNYGPHVRDPELILKLSDGKLAADKTIVVKDQNESVIDESFNKGPIDVGPVRGLEYYDEVDGIHYVWNDSLNTYVPYDRLGTGNITPESAPVFVPSLPENHIDSRNILAVYEPWNSNQQIDETISYRKNTVVRHNALVYMAARDITIDDNSVFTETAANSAVLWTNVSTALPNKATEGETYPVPEVQAIEQLVPSVIPGTGQLSTSRPRYTPAPYYNMAQTVVLSDIELPKYRLGVSYQYLFEVYEIAQNDDDHIYYVLVDKSNPAEVNATLDYFETVSAYSDFNGLPATDYYYRNDIVPTLDADKKITNTNDPIRLKYTKNVISLPPAEPAAYVGRQLIAEPFAVSGGNNSDAVANINNIPGLRVVDNRVIVDNPGWNRFFIWTPGLEPGKWAPTVAGPGFLTGVNGNNTNFGYGRGYYAENDNHLSNEYPNIQSYIQEGQSAYTRTMPRFAYSKKFTVSPEWVNQDTITYTDAEGNPITEDEAIALGDDAVTLVTPPVYVDTNNEDAGVTGMRPDEVFVACFWTEKFEYVNQLIDVDYTTRDASGQPNLIYGNYDGTVTRVKYIRLTELPETAITRRLIPDTGWAGKGWNNRVVDNENLPLTDSNIVSVFAPTTTTGGSTGGPDANGNVTLQIGDPTDSGPVRPATNDSNGVAVVNNRGNLGYGDSNPRETVPVTELGPVLNADAFQNLPGPCVSLPSPVPVKPDASPTSCNEKKLEDITITVTNKDAGIRGAPITLSDNSVFLDSGVWDGVDINEVDDLSTYPNTFDKATWQFVNIRVAGNRPVRVFSDFGENTYGSIVVVQNTTPYFSPAADDPDSIAQWDDAAWWSTASTVITTDVSGAVARRNGNQVGAYGVDIIDQQFLNTTLISEVSSHFGYQDGRSETYFDNTPNRNGIDYTVDSATGDVLTGQHRVSASHIQTGDGYFSWNDPTVSIPDSLLGRWKKYDIGVKYENFIQQNVDCQRGEYVTIFFRPDESVSRGDVFNDNPSNIVWRSVIQFSGELVDLTTGDAPSDATCENAGSRGWASGAVKQALGFGVSGGYAGHYDGERTTGDKKRLDNIYYPYNPMPNPYNSDIMASPDANWGNWTHHNPSNRRWGGSPEIRKTTTGGVRSLNGRITIPQRTTFEYKGYFRAPHNGIYEFRGYSDDMVWMWISSEPTGKQHLGKPLRKGVDDLAGLISGDERKEYFKEDGYRPDDPYNYHRDNAVLHNGWISTKQKNKSPLPGEKYVELEAGKYYFVRILTANRKGPGYFEVKWHVQDNSVASGPEFDADFDVWEYPNGGYYNISFNNYYLGGSGYYTATKSGFIEFSGRACGSDAEPQPDPTDEPAENNNATDGQIAEQYGPGNGLDGSNAGGGGDGGLTFGGGSSTSGCEIQSGDGNVLFNIVNGNLSLYNGQPEFSPAPPKISLAELKENPSLAAQYGFDPCTYQYGTNPSTNNDTPIYSPGSDATAGNVGTGGRTGGGEGGIGSTVNRDFVNLGLEYTTVTLPDGSTVQIPRIDFWDINFSFGNSTQPGQSLMTGFNFMPYSMKKIGTRAVKDPNQFIFSDGMVNDDTPVSGLMQRTSGGLIMPYARTVTVTNRTRPDLRKEDVSNEPWSKTLQNNTNLGKTTRYIRYEPKKISSTYTVGGKAIRNVTSSATEFVLQNSGTSNTNSNDVVTYVGPAGPVPYVESGTDAGRTLQDGGLPTNIAQKRAEQQQAQLKRQRQEQALADVNNIRYNNAAVIDITPFKHDGNGNYQPAGPAALVQPRKPTPETRIKAEDLIGIPAGTELLINNRRIVIRGTGLIDIKSQVNCANMGVSALIDPATNSLDLVSCGGAPFTIGNGCGAGTYQQVGDFHINRGFDQGETVSQTLMLPFIDPLRQTTESSATRSSNGVVSTSSKTTNIGGGQDVVDYSAAGAAEQTEVIYDYERLPDGTLVQYNYTGRVDDDGNIIPERARTPARIPLVTKNKSTGGSNYRVGDRLRLIGGTPINDATGPIAKLCIDSAGAGYSDPLNIKVVFNENGTSPGIAAAAVVTLLDANGGIAEIALLNNGAAYDPENPPKIEIIDTKPVKDYDILEVNTQWPQQADVPAGTVLKLLDVQEELDSSGRTTNTEVIGSRHIRLTEARTLGQEHTIEVSGKSIYFNNPNDPLETTGTISSVVRKLPSVVAGKTYYNYAVHVAVDNRLSYTVAMVNITEALSGDTFSADVDSVSHSNGTFTYTFSLTTVDQPLSWVSGDNVSVVWDERSSPLSGAIPRPGFVVYTDQHMNIQSYTQDGVGTVFRVNPGTYAEIEYYPANGLNDFNATVTSDVSGSQTFNVISTTNLNVGMIVTQIVSEEFVVAGVVTDITGNTITLRSGDTITATAESTVYFGDKQRKLLKMPPANYYTGADDEFVSSQFQSGMYSDRLFFVDDSVINESVLLNMFGVQDAPVSITFRQDWTISLLNSASNTDSYVDLPDPRIPFTEAKVSAIIGNPELSDAELLRQKAGPLRVAKFIVTDVDDKGAITALRIIDRGLYSQFPGDLTYGIPLEYDYESQGAFTVNPDTINSQSSDSIMLARGEILGIGDPARNNLLYGPGHPEYNGWPFVQDYNSDDLDVLAQADKDKLETLLDKIQTQGISSLTTDERTQYQSLLMQLRNSGYTTSNKHPDWSIYPEFKSTGQTDDLGRPVFVPYAGTPGAYDPTTFVVINLANLSVDEYINNPSEFAAKAWALGLLKTKTRAIETTDEKSTRFGDYVPNEVAGGTGARVFLTAQDIVNCTEKGTAKETLDLPDVVTEVSLPKSLARAMNDAFAGAGYLPDDIKAVFNPIGELGELVIESPFPQVKIDSPTPGFVDKLGLPVGTYDTAMLCIDATLEKADETAFTEQEVIDDLNSLYDSDSLGLLGPEQLRQISGLADTDARLENAYVMSLVCAEVIQPTPGGGGETDPDSTDPRFGDALPVSPRSRGIGAGPSIFGMNDNNSLFGNSNRRFVNEMYRYDIENIFGERIKLGGTKKQSTEVLYFASKRFNNNNLIEMPGDDLFASVDLTNPLSELPEIYNEGNAWVDSYTSRGNIVDLTGNTHRAYDMPGFVEGGWAYLENGVPKRWQTELVDVNFVNSALIYNPESGTKTFDLNFWDPFKGVLPGLIQNEIHYISDRDPVSYNNARTNFGANNIGKVWWDTSTVKYMWYEQGTDAERAENWGKTFPGSSITVCEWVESAALPANWRGNGVPRWSDRFVTERRYDQNSGEYKNYYYYWVINRTVVDDRVTRDLGRKLDIRTISRYIADPVGYGLNVASFVSDTSVLMYNTNQLRDQENHLQINISRNANPEGIKHTAWKLLRENDARSIIPDYLSDKLIDSLCGENAQAQPVPDPRLSEVEKYGIQFRPRQGMFVNVNEARRVMTSVLNRILANTRLNTNFFGWDKELPNARAYINTTNWYAAKRVDPKTNEVIRYNSTSKPVFNVTSVAELYSLKDIADGTVIQVRSNQNSVAQLWIYNGSKNDYELISVYNDTVQLRDTVFTDPTNPTLSSELRHILVALRDRVFVNSVHWNELFFELMKYAYMEQGQLSWAFKTSYLFIEKEEDDLVQFTGFKPDNFQKVLDYMSEVKPYNAKIREYKDGKRTPVDLIGQNNVSDYDKPPYVDTSSNTVRILDNTSIADRRIMANSKLYIDYITATLNNDIESTPIRRGNTTITFDRTNWQLTESNWDVANVTLQQSIGYNIANLSVATKKEIENSTTVRASDRLFKFDPQIQATFIVEVNTYFNDVTAARNPEIVGNGTVMAELVASGQLKNTLALIKDKVGGNFRGETLDGSIFSSIIDNADYYSQIQTEFGFDSEPFDENTDNDNTVFTDSRDTANYGEVTSIGVGDNKWDAVTQIVSYEGVFNTNIQGNVTLRKNGDNYEGFDGVTFQRVLYGEERPEELALIDPLESVIMTVTTSEFSRGAAGVVSIYDGLDEANSLLFHNTISLDNIVIENSGVGYVNPVVVIQDADGVNPGAVASATASVDANGAITAITIDEPGSGYTSIRVSLDEDLSANLVSDVQLFSKQLELDNTSQVRVGQLVLHNNTTLGKVASIVNSSNILLDSLVMRTISSGSTIDFAGHGFTYSIDIVNEVSPESNVYLDKAFVDQHKYLKTIYANSFFTVPGNVSVYDFQNVISFPGIVTNNGKDPDNENNFYSVDTVNGWDSASEDGVVGSFDVALTEVQERITTKIPFGKEVTYRIHQSLFGDTDYLRISSGATTTLAKEMKFSSTSITLVDASFLPSPTTLTPGSIWVGTERIQYGRKNGNVLTALTRGAFGTTPQDHPVGTNVYSAEQNEHFNHLNPRSNVWLDVGTKYSAPEAWDEINAGLNNIIESQFGNAYDDPNNPTVIGGDDILRAWDEMASGNVTVSTVSATVTASSITQANLTLVSNMTLTVGEAVRIANPSNVAETEVVTVSAVDGLDISVEASYNDTLDTSIFVQSGTVDFSSFDYGAQAGDDKWDAAAISGQTAVSLADRANIDLANSSSIMKFLHGL